MWLTKYTSPYGFEQERFGSYFLDLGCTQDEHGNYVLEIGESTTMFAAHIDTADRQLNRVRRQIHGDFIYTDGKTILGADDRAGVAVLLHLIRNKIPGRYVFFVGEEAGRVGSEFAAKDGLGAGMDRMICWDRMGEDSIITHQMMDESCSPAFAKSLAAEYGDYGMAMKLDNTGTYTDSFSFLGDIPECTNLSIGYYNPHTVNEFQDARYLVRMAEASIQIKWEDLPTVRNPEDYYSVPSTYDTYTWKGYGGDYQYSQGKNRAKGYDYSTSADLIQAAEWGILSLQDVEGFVYADPEEASKLLYDYLRGIVK